MKASFSPTFVEFYFFPESLIPFSNIVQVGINILAWAAITKCHGLGGLKQQTYISHSSGGWKFIQIKMPTDSTSGESLLPELQTDCYPLQCAHWLFLDARAWTESSLPLIIRVLISSWGPALMTSSKPN